jgi:hypothetical protein
MACAFCRQPITGTYFQFGPRTVCPNCAAQLDALRKRNDFDSAAWMRAAALGLAVAIGGGLVWAVVAKITHYELGILAVAIGWIVCVAVRKASGGRRGRPMQALAVGLAVIGVLAGKVLTVLLVALEHASLTRAIEITIHLLATMPQELFSFFDLIWIVIAVLAPIRVFKPINVELRGPYDQAAGQTQHLQFDRIEPAPPPMPPGGA